MTQQLELTHPIPSPVVHGRRSSGSFTLRIPRVVWPIGAMVLMVPVVAVLLLALFT